MAASYATLASAALASNSFFSSGSISRHRRPNSLPTSPSAKSGFFSSTSPRVSLLKIMNADNGRLGSFGSFFAFAFAFAFDLVFFFGRASSSSSLPSLPDESVGSPSSDSEPASKSSSSSESLPPKPSSSSSLFLTLALSRAAWWSLSLSLSAPSMIASARACASTLTILSFLAVRKETRFWNSLLGMEWNWCTAPLRMETAMSNVRCVVGPAPACLSNSISVTSAYGRSIGGLGR
mmetsp:Transcript_11591/g.49968  ORF Transcript_11591/g.49968 Transcript_11591/m.49968 type:complete len:236 (+) Transcript_11591:151-858(+)